MPRWMIEKEFAFEASHQLTRVPDGHPCGRVHGHSYRVCIQIAGQVHPLNGWLVDFRWLAWFDELLRDQFDHHHLNDVVEFETTSERLAEHFHALIARRLGELPVQPPLWLRRVGVSETRRTWAWYGPLQ